MTANELKHQEKLREWQASVAECRSSGLSVRQWCQGQNVHPTTYYKWEREVLGPNIRSRQSGAFVELPASKTQGNVYERIATIRYREFSVDVCGGVSKQELMDILEVIQSC